MSSDCFLEGNSPKEITAFNNKAFVKELIVKCPMWFSIVNGACSISSKSPGEKHRRSFNVISVATSVLARFRNAKLSALAYRISMLLLHDGLSHFDIKRLNHLGVCMLPDSSIELQRKMGTSADAKVILWKESVEDVLRAQLFLGEILQKQFLCMNDEHATEAADMKEDVLKGYLIPHTNSGSLD